MFTQCPTDVHEFCFSIRSSAWNIGAENREKWFVNYEIDTQHLSLNEKDYLKSLIVGHTFAIEGIRLKTLQKIFS